MYDEIRSQEEIRKEKVEGKGFSPERYGMVFCSNCSGSGRYFYGSKGASVCEVCGGFGLVRTERNRTYDGFGTNRFRLVNGGF